MTSGQLLALARDVIGRPVEATRGLWPRAASVLARQALERAIQDFWEAKAVEIRHCSWKAKLLCLRGYVPEELAREATATHIALSRACHYLPYELQPNLAELRDWLASVERVCERLAVQR